MIIELLIHDLPSNGQNLTLPLGSDCCIQREVNEGKSDADQAGSRGVATVIAVTSKLSL
jgi:hypothetical protein